MNKVLLIDLQWNCHNGFIFTILLLELYKPINIDSALFGISFCSRFLYIDILFFTIKVFDKNDRESTQQIY